MDELDADGNLVGGTKGTASQFTMIRITALPSDGGSNMRPRSTGNVQSTQKTNKGLLRGLAAGTEIAGG